MPQIKVVEKDLSWYYRQRTPGQLTVMMPGVATFGPNSPTLVSDENFVKYFGSGSVHTDDLSYQMAASYIKTGIEVLFWRLNINGSSVAKSGLLSKGKVTLTGPTTSAHPIEIGRSNDDKVKAVTINVPTGTTEFYLPIYDTSLSSNEVKSCITAGLTAGTTDDSGLFGISSLTDQADSGLYIRAKWSGTYGNGLSVNVKGSGNVKYFSVYSGGVLVESLVYNFTNPQDAYYYEIVNQDSSFIEVVPNDNFNVSTVNSLILQEAVKLSGGADYATTNVNDYYLNGDTAVQDTTGGKYIISGSGTSTDPYVVAGSFNDLVVKTIENDITLGEESTIEQLKDHLTYNFDIVTSAGYNDIKLDSDTKLPSGISKIDDIFINLVESRGNAIYLVDGTKDMKYDDLYLYTGYPSPDDISTFVGESSAGFNTSYAACIGPWSTSQLLSNGNSRVLPGSYVFLVSWGQSLANGTPKWMAPAGVKRASVGNIVKSTVYPVGSAVLDVWQNHDKVSDNMFKHKLNPIINLSQYGYVIYGNSTLLQDRYDGSTSMLNALSVRIVANMIKTQSRNVALQLQFDQLDDDLFAQFKTLMTVFMDQLKYGGALYDYNIIVDRSELTFDDINSRTVPVRIQISPNPAVENFIINLEISQAGVDFGDETLDMTSEQS